jgi:prepilin-type N-terminal cleavage/methylation domain-containing protein
MKNKLKYILKLPVMSESGFTLIEMLVAMVIAVIFFASFTAVVMATMETLKTGDQRTVAQQNARTAINFMADEIVHMAELEPPPFSEYRDYLTGGLPRNGELADEFGNEVYPILRLSTDSSDRGYIDLNHADAQADIDEYEDFRSDGMPYDVRPLFPNRLDFLMSDSAYFPHTRYSSLSPELAGNALDIDGASADFRNNNDNAQSARVRVSYEHRKQPPRFGLETDRGLKKNLYLPVFSASGGGVNLYDKSFLVLRNFQVENVTGQSPNDITQNQTIKFYNLMDDRNNDTGVDLPGCSNLLREIVADHIVDVRFRYFHIRGGIWIEIKYDPYTTHMDQDGSGLPANVNDGYYRYYDQNGTEIYAWSTPTDKIDLPDPGDIPSEHFADYSELTFMPMSEYQRGLLLFEGWRFVNTVMITVKGANNELQQKYITTISQEITNTDPDSTDFGLGFTDFQKGSSYLNDPEGYNVADPLWHALDSNRDGISTRPDSDIKPWDADTFDFVEPNTNPMFDPGRFVTLQTMVTPPELEQSAYDAARQLRFGLTVM